MKTSLVRTAACRLLQPLQLLTAVTVFAFCTPHLKAQCGGDAGIPALDPVGALRTIGVTQLRSPNFHPELDGRGVDVVHAEPRSSATGSSTRPHYQVNPSKVGQPQSLFTWISDEGTANQFPNNLGCEHSHAVGIGKLFYGRATDTTPEGVAYGVNHVNNWEFTDFLNSRIIPEDPVIGGKVVNQSVSYGEENNQSYDNYVARHGTIFASTISNDGGPDGPGTAYNLIGVGAVGGESAVGPNIDGRSKPDITAPAPSTSFAAPLVAGAAAILVQAAGSTPLETADNDSRTVKALLLNGAIKPKFEPTMDGNWIRVHNGVFREPLDRRYGSGVLNVFNSYKQWQAGRTAPTMRNVATPLPISDSGVTLATVSTPPGPSTTLSTTATKAGWDFNSVTTPMTGGNVENQYLIEILGIPSDAYNGSVTLNWNRQNGQTQINNLELFLTSATDDVPLESSESPIDNVEHLDVEGLRPGQYRLRVVKLAANRVSDNEDYAVAFNFAPLPRIVSRKLHAGIAYDVDLPTTDAPPGVECRDAGPSGQHQIVFSFPAAVSPLTFREAALRYGNGSVQSTSASGNEITVNLTGVTDAQYITVALLGVNDGQGQTDVGVKMGVLAGDTNADTRVNVGDTNQVKANSGQLTTTVNFRTDVNLDGRLNVGDTNFVKERSGTFLP